MSEIPVLLSTRQAARVLGVTTRTILRFIDSRTLAPAFRFDNGRGAYLFRESDVHDLARRRRERSPAA